MHALCSVKPVASHSELLHDGCNARLGLSTINFGSVSITPNYEVHRMVMLFKRLEHTRRRQVLIQIQKRFE
jgi:hypothetical protein